MRVLLAEATDSFQRDPLSSQRTVPCSMPEVAQVHDDDRTAPIFATYFTQYCPICGRPTRVPVGLLAEVVGCQHCRAPFVAEDDAGPESLREKASLSLLARAEALLARLRPT